MGFFTVDRQIVTAILGTFLTYLIILLQWPSIDEDALPDSMNTLCCAAFGKISTDMDLIEPEKTANMVSLSF